MGHIRRHSSGTGPVRNILMRSTCVVQRRDTFTASSNAEEFQFDGVEVAVVSKCRCIVLTHSHSALCAAVLAELAGWRRGKSSPFGGTGVVADEGPPKVNG